MNGQKSENTKEPLTQHEEILLVEDSAPNLRILSFLVQKFGFTAVECSNGKDAWEYLSSKSGSKISALITDVMMPEMTGIELLQKIRAHSTLNALPSAIVTAVPTKETVTQASSLGVSQLIVKPISEKKIRIALTALFPDRDFNNPFTRIQTG